MPRDLIEVLTGEWPAVAGIGVAVVGVTSWVKNLFDIRKCTTEIRLIEEQISAQRIQNQAATEKLSDERRDRELATRQARRAELERRRARREKINRRLAGVTPLLAMVLIAPIWLVQTRTHSISSPGGELHPPGQLAKDLSRLTETMISGQSPTNPSAIIDPAALEELKKVVDAVAAQRGTKLKLEFQGKTDGNRIWIDIADEKNRAVASVVFVTRNNKAERIEVPFNDLNPAHIAK